MAVIHYVAMLQMIILLFWPIKTATASEQSLKCSYECGNITINYPFGIGKGCYFDESFEVRCENNSSGHPRAFLASVNSLELVNVDYDDSMVRVNIPIISLDSGKPTSNSKGVNLSGSPFTFSTTVNRFVAVGCDDYTTIDNVGNNSNVSNFGGCLSICTCDPTQNSGCYDFLCNISPNNSKVFNANISHIYSRSIPQKCSSVSMVDKEWLVPYYLNNSYVLKDEEQLPATLEWGEYKGNCYNEYNSYATCNLDNRCLIQLSSGYLCLCYQSYDPVTDRFCAGSLICNTTSPYNCSNCPDGYNSSYGYCIQLYPREIFNEIAYKSRVKFTIIGCSSGLGLLFLLVGIWWLYKFIKRRRQIKLQQKHFKKNGGLLLRQELSSNQGNIEKTKLFTSKELEKATDNYNANRILGQGGQGTVFKGMLADGKIVAVKKSKIVDESNIEQFINEVVILSQINHRNVVKLFGCCLETEVPLLVYEFIPNGTLFQYLHDQTEEFPLTWEMRLSFAVEVSGALFYLHSAASIPIYHRDIKSANILLDDKYRAKVSDFGTSRSVMVDQTHLTTQVHGTFGYVDPEYFRSSQFTEKSDVYSFGVVLVELLTGQKPIRYIESEENRSLAAYFLQSMKDDRLFEILDSRVLKEAEKEEITTVASLAKRCLNLNGKKRPTMKEVAFELARLRAPNEASLMLQNIEEIDSEDEDITGHFETGSSPTCSFLNSVAFSLDVDPLISKKQ